MGTVRLDAELLARFPGMRVSRLDRDSATSAEEVTAILASLARGEKDVLNGTQMVAKGHDFPGVTLVDSGWVDCPLPLGLFCPNPFRPIARRRASRRMPDEVSARL